MVSPLRGTRRRSGKDHVVPQSSQRKYTAIPVSVARFTCRPWQSGHWSFSVSGLGTRIGSSMADLMVQLGCHNSC